MKLTPEQECTIFILHIVINPNHLLPPTLILKVFQSLLFITLSNVNVNGKRIERSHGSGRKPKIMDKKGINALSKAFDHSCSISQRQAARKFKCSQQYISKTLKKKTAIIYKKKTKIPARSETQKAKIKTRINRMVRDLSKLDVLDDESYFNKSNNNNISDAGFYTRLHQAMSSSNQRKSLRNIY